MPKSLIKGFSTVSAITTGLAISISNTYILFPTKMQKGKPGEISLPFIEKRYQIFSVDDIYIFIADIRGIAISNPVFYDVYVSHRAIYQLPK